MLSLLYCPVVDPSAACARQLAQTELHAALFSSLIQSMRSARMSCCVEQLHCWGELYCSGLHAGSTPAVLQVLLAGHALLALISTKNNKSKRTVGVGSWLVGVCCGCSLLSATGSVGVHCVPATVVHNNHLFYYHLAPAFGVLSVRLRGVAGSSGSLCHSSNPVLAWAVRRCFGQTVIHSCLLFAKLFD